MVFVYDYRKKREYTDIWEFDEEIKKITVQVLSGDEVVTIKWKDYEDTVIDAGYNRAIDFDDGEYTVFDEERGIDRREEWQERKDSYDVFFID